MRLVLQPQVPFISIKFFLFTCQLQMCFPDGHPSPASGDLSVGIVRLRTKSHEIIIYNSSFVRFEVFTA
jgi:hypothetical protein